MKSIPVAIALGSNLGNSQQIVCHAVEMIESHPQIELINVSSWHQTKPVGPPQPDYINGCITINTQLLPEDLLNFLLNIETQFGRERTIRWGARTLDLDLILYGDLILDTPQLQIPHPRMRERAFVLVPLAEIASDWIEPITQLTISQLLSHLYKKRTKVNEGSD
jgi:2-amino-4-hydroxy-6-hydroxymethyldihydropteridine diphosphokinase